MAAGTPATTLLTRLKVAHTLHPYEHDDAATSYGEEASTLLGVPAHQLFKTLIASADGRLVCAVVPVSGRLDLKALARAIGAKRVVMAESGAAQRATGYVVGGISPLGQRTRLPVVIDESALAQTSVFVSAGRRGLQVQLAPADLVRAAAASTAAIAESTSA